ncbi:UMTA methyltransferase family protein [Rutstroemia sp. NJR-2017a BBW]|nr:UMTA methyltransferase family protein [Rutstroemia sp. NJR-2017a BBW]
MTNPPPKTDWSLSSGHGYILQRTASHLSSCRLNLQHYLWKDTLQFSIHPSISPNLPPHPLIADLATGTSISRASFPMHNSTVSITISSRSWLPENVDIQYWDVFDEVPDEMVGKYDFVHVRLLILVLGNKSQVHSLAQKIMKMLKSGGCIQWDELDAVDMSITKATPETQAPALEQLREKSWAGRRYDWTVEIPNVLREEGFEDVGGKVYGDEMGLVRAFNEQHLWTMDEFARRLMGLGMREAAETFWGLVEEGEWETVRGAGLCIPRIVSTERKPL